MFAINGIYNSIVSPLYLSYLQLFIICIKNKMQAYIISSIDTNEKTHNKDAKANKY